MKTKKYKFILVCPKCKNEISHKNVSKGYFSCCKNCDEDFYAFELRKKRVKL